MIRNLFFDFPNNSLNHSRYLLDFIKDSESCIVSSRSCFDIIKDVGIVVILTGCMFLPLLFPLPSAPSSLIHNTDKPCRYYALINLLWLIPPLGASPI